MSALCGALIQLCLFFFFSLWPPTVCYKADLHVQRPIGAPPPPHLRPRHPHPPRHRTTSAKGCVRERQAAKRSDSASMECSTPRWTPSRTSSFTREARVSGVSPAALPPSEVRLRRAELRCRQQLLRPPVWRPAARRCRHSTRCRGCGTTRAACVLACASTCWRDPTAWRSIWLSFIPAYRLNHFWSQPGQLSFASLLPSSSARKLSQVRTSKLLFPLCGRRPQLQQSSHNDDS